MSYGSKDSIFRQEHYGQEGRGLAFSTEIAYTDAFRLKESPAIAYKHKFSRLTTFSCDYCFKCIGSINDYFKFISSIYKNHKFSTFEYDILNKEISSFIKCSNSCGSYFCSQECYKLALDNGHDLLCKMDNISKLYWDQFQKYSMSISETMIFAGMVVVDKARIVCQILYRHVNKSHKIEDQMQYYLEFYNKPWHEIKQYEHNKAKECITYTLSLLKASLLVYAKLHGIDIDLILSFDFYSKLMGMIELVAVDIEVGSAHNQLIISNIDNIFADVVKQLIRLKELIEGTTVNYDILNNNIQTCTLELGNRLIPDVIGLGIFNTFSRLNHSCEPNIEISYGDSFVAEARLLRGVTCGEQAYISYIDEQLGYEDRRERLSKYLFKCICKKCNNKI